MEDLKDFILMMIMCLVIKCIYRKNNNFSRVYICCIVFLFIVSGCREKPVVKVFPKIEEMVAEQECYVNPGKLPENHTYFYMRDSMDISDLRMLMEHSNPEVRTYCFAALVERGDSAVYQILLRHLSDTAYVCEYRPPADEWRAGYVYSFLVADKMIDIGLESLTKEQQDSLCDTIILKYHNLSTAKEIFYKLAPHEKYYPVVKEMALQDYDISVFVALAMFRKQEDIGLIKEYIKKADLSDYLTFKPIAVFPDTAFFPMLVQHFDSLEYKNIITSYSHYFFIRAIAQYQREECLEIFEDMCKKQYLYAGDSKKFVLGMNKAVIWKAIKCYYCPLYEKLYKRLDKEVSDVDKIIAESQEASFCDTGLWQ